MSELNVLTATFSCTWGEREIRWLYAKLSDIDNKLATGPGLQTPSAILDQDLDVRVGLLDGEVNMMKLEIDKLWTTLKEILADLAEQKRTIDNVGRYPSVPAAVDTVTAVIKEEPNFDFDPASEFNGNDTEAFWPGLFTVDVDDTFSPSDDQITKGYTGRAGPHRSTRSSPKKSEPQEQETNQNETDTETAAESNQQPIIIAPNPDLVAKSKELLGDIQADASTGKFPCPQCPKQFCHKKDLIRHYFLHSGVKPYGCTLCPKTFARGDKLIKHIKLCHFDGEVGSKTPRQPKTARSKFSIPAPKPKPTEVCCKLCPGDGTSFRRPEMLAEHYTKYHQPPKGTQTLAELSTPCSTFCRLPVLARHRKRKHPSPEEAAARKGQKQQASAKRSAFRRKFQIQRVKELNEESGYACPDCGRVFQLKNKLNTHIIICRGLKPFKCEDCDRAFAQKGTLKVHCANVHQKQKRYLCADCGQSFFMSTSYKRHVRSHLGIKPYACKYCGRSFTGANDRRRHEMIHTGVKKVQCPQCDLRFHRPYTLKRHMRVHTGERPYICDVCGMGFTQTGSLKKHKEWHDRIPIRTAPVTGRKPRATIKPRESRLLKQLELQQQQQSSERSVCVASTTEIGPGIPSTSSQPAEEPHLHPSATSSTSRSTTINPDLVNEFVTHAHLSNS